MPISGIVIQHVDARKMIVFGLLTAASSLFLMSRFNLEIDFRAAMWPRMVFGVGLAFLFVPLATMTFAFVPREALGNATGIYNLMRNIGGSAGIALVTTLLDRRAQFHQSVLAAHITAYDPGTQLAARNTEALVALQGTPWPVVVPPPTPNLLYGQMLQQANMLAVVDSFWVLGVATVVLVLGAFLLRRRGGGAAAAAH